MERIVLGNLELDRDRFDVRIDGEPIALSYLQFDLLYQLASSAGTVIDQQRLLREVWGDAPAEGARKLRIHVSRLRKKIANSRPWHIRTVTKRGYALTDAGSPAVASSSQDVKASVTRA